MTDTTGNAPSVAAAPTAPDESVGLLLQSLTEVSEVADPIVDHGGRRDFESQLAMVRLGMATSLFYALRTKHAATAAHSLRVAIACSAWAQRSGLAEPLRDRIEVAALLHDVGKIGIPDRILRKPGKLSVEEQLVMDSCPQLACNILRGCTSDQELLAIVAHANEWFDSRRQEEKTRSNALPLGSRMLAIAGAFDSMTTEHVYRRAMSRERALGELHRRSGTQFDPELVLEYVRMMEERPELLQGTVRDRWLQQLNPEQGNQLWAAPPPSQEVSSNRAAETSFFQRLSDGVRDGVAFTDSEGMVTQWNAAMQRLTTISSEAMVGQTWSDQVVRLRDGDGGRDESVCPVSQCLRTGVPSVRDMQIEQPDGTPTPVRVEVLPVTGTLPGRLGVVVMMRDLSEEASLEERLEALHEQATKDPLTGVANRAEMDRALAEMTDLRMEGGPTFSLIICDIDYFKRVNDTHGHPAGDEALVTFAQVLTGQSREGDLVARYGGEEFVLLAINCDNATATQRAEDIRRSLESTPLPSLNNETITASFGVTEFQTGDSPETILARADRALLQAKDNGRNRVVQLGCGAQGTEVVAPISGWMGWFTGGAGDRDHEARLVTPVPIDLAIEKLKGFIADHAAEIISVKENEVSIRLTASCRVGGRRAVDHHISLSLVVQLSESIREQKTADLLQKIRETAVHARIKPTRNRDRRRRELKQCVDQVIASLNSYIMGRIIARGEEAS
ncbi:MAG: diguanylate cyclase [Planctomycetota bacterium]